ncbi:Retrovirus-related Pol polyprotein type-1 like protein [Argiope bruennichi]|uniref:Retrovirus-related Pol polyprotein type-1 like protein n=1 Tax=Argiope bruennichi TaxID=94029 RepID=A0A8T0FJL6_ARGBR|nr:Retrovirus-related Pol polyprotein type-1 like protein [Argiope bruennichi]
MTERLIKSIQMSGPKAQDCKPNRKGCKQRVGKPSYCQIHKSRFAEVQELWDIARDKLMTTIIDDANTRITPDLKTAEKHFKALFETRNDLCGQLEYAGRSKCTLPPEFTPDEKKRVITRCRLHGASEPDGLHPVSHKRVLKRVVERELTILFNMWLRFRKVPIFQMLINENQRGFALCDGIGENNFLSARLLREGNVSNPETAIVPLDFACVFDSVGHVHLFSALERLGELSGVKQGCPLSGILFNLAIDPAIRRLQEDSNRHRVLAFADDIALIEDTPALLQAKLDELFQELSRIQLELNPAKSVALHLSGRTPVGTRDTSFSIGGVPLVSLKDFDSHRFLGKPVGFNVLPEFASLNEVAKIGTKLVESALPPWQRLDALKSFFPSTQFAMRTAQFKKTNWEVVDKALRPGIKNTLNLPENAANEYIYGNRSLGCCGIPIAAEESDLNLIDTAFKLLTSKDDCVARLTLEQHTATVRHRIRRNPSDLRARRLLRNCSIKQKKNFKRISFFKEKTGGYGLKILQRNDCIMLERQKRFTRTDCCKCEWRKKYFINEILKEHGRVVLRLPAYHCDLNPIELIWADIKRYVRERNATADMSLQRLENLASEAITNIGNMRWEKHCKHIEHIEKKYWETDSIVEEVVENISFYINTDSDTESNFSDDDTDDCYDDEH